MGRHGLMGAVEAEGDELTDTTHVNPSWLRLSRSRKMRFFSRAALSAWLPRCGSTAWGSFSACRQLGARASLPKGFEVRANGGPPSGRRPSSSSTSWRGRCSPIRI